MDKDTGKSLQQEIADLLPATRQWMQERGYLVNVVEDGHTLPRLTKKGEEWVNSVYFNRSNSKTDDAG